MPPTLMIALVGSAVVAIGLSAWFAGERRLRRALARAPRRSIAEFPEGTPARLVGAVVAGESLRAPLTGRACVFYVVHVQESRDHGGNGWWSTLVREVRGAPFVVDDGTGRALIDPTNAHLAIEQDACTESGGLDAATPVQAELLARHGKRSSGWIFNKTLRYQEGVLEIGETVAVCGVAVREPDPDAAARATGYRDALPTRLRLMHSDQQPLQISDHADAKR